MASAVPGEGGRHVREWSRALEASSFWIGSAGVAMPVRRPGESRDPVSSALKSLGPGVRRGDEYEINGVAETRR